MPIAQQLEAILFWKAEPISFKKLATLLNVSADAITQGLTELEQVLKGRGLTLVRTEDEVMLGTAQELSPLIEQLTKEELSRDLGKAGLETLSIILYQGPISRADIDYIRGVNSQFIVRNLLIRGLIERVENPKDARSYLYKTTLQLLSHLGISKIEDLPEYEQVRRDIEGFKSSGQESQPIPDATNQPETN
jgi:segregation and condensation protein B